MLFSVVTVGGCARVDVDDSVVHMLKETADAADVQSHKSKVKGQSVLQAPQFMKVTDTNA